MGHTFSGSVRNAIDREATSVQIDGQTWTRQPTDSVEAKLADARQHIADLYIERDQARALAHRMRQAIDLMEGAMYGCDELLNLQDTYEREDVRDDLLLAPLLRWSELKRIFAALDELNRIVNDPAFNYSQFTEGLEARD